MLDFTSFLPADKNTTNSRRQVLGASFSHVKPIEFPNAKLIHLNEGLFQELGLNKDYIEFLESKKVNPGYNSFAMNYSGHQFGQWAGQLGDGRAITIDNIKDHLLQLKGVGPTPYSRGGDGFAVLRSSVREYLCAEALFNLGIPTTRSLSLSFTGEKVARDMLYNGNVEYEYGASVCRVSKSFLRFGSFENHAARQEFDILEKLIDYTYTNLYSSDNPLKTVKEKALHVLEEVAQRSLELVINWTRVGFVHGVLNTDNLSIIGETIDYGPFGWLESYDTKWTPNTSDSNGRYSFGNQGEMVLWNLLKLAEAFYPLVNESEPLERILHNFRDNYHRDFHFMFSTKLGLNNISKSFVDATKELLTDGKLDYTIFHRSLSSINIKSDFTEFDNLIKSASYLNDFSDQFYSRAHSWFEKYIQLIDDSNLANRTAIMDETNPKFVLRNYLLFEAIDELNSGSDKLFLELYKAISEPYDNTLINDKYFKLSPEWSFNTVGCSRLSCSS